MIIQSPQSFYLNIFSRFVRLFLWVALFVSSQVLGAASADKQSYKSTANAQWAMVAIQGTAIYRAPSFDAPIMEYLPYGLKVKISKKVYHGVGGLGLFFKTRTKKGIIGYIVDTELSLANVPRAQSDQKADDEAQDIYEDFDQYTPESSLPPIFFTRYMGAAFNYVNITEKLGGKSHQSFYPMYGFKATGPKVIFDSPSVDAELLFGVGAPGYYDDFSTSNGFIALGSVMFLSGLADYDSAMLYYGMGIMTTFSKLDVKVKGQSSTLDSQSLRGGIAFSLGYAWRIKSWIMRFESKYYIEKEQYLGLGLSLQAPL